MNRSFTYTASGQAATDQRSPVSAWSYTTDKAGRISAAVLNSVTQATFAYDGDELRIANTNNLTSAITHYVYDADGHGITGTRNSYSSSACAFARRSVLAQLSLLQ